MSDSEPRLSGVRVLLTRPRERSQELSFLLEDEGAEVLSVPLLELAPPEDPRPLKAAAEQLQRYAWIVFASPSGIQAWVEAVREAGTGEHLRRPRVAVVGPRTAQAAREFGLDVAVEAQVNTGTGLAEALKTELHAGDEILMPAAQEGRLELLQELEDAGHRVSRVAAYRSTAGEVSDEVVSDVLATPPKVILFASPRTVEAFMDRFGEKAPELLAGAGRVAIGPTTAAALERLGHPASAVAERPTSEALLEAAIQAVRG